MRAQNGGALAHTCAAHWLLPQDAERSDLDLKSRFIYIVVVGAVVRGGVCCLAARFSFS